MVARQMRKKRVPLTKPWLDEREFSLVRKTLSSGWLAQGPRVAEFEGKLAKYLGARYVVATSSCTTSLSLAIEALGLAGSGAIVVPDFTFPATANVVLRGGCGLEISDVSASYYAIDPAALRKRITRKTSGLIPVHPFGHPFPMAEVYELAARRGLEVIEDAATAIGTMYGGERVGRRGRAVCFSFHPRKLITTGEGGALVTDDPEVKEAATALRNHGQVMSGGRARFVRRGLNYRMSDVHASLGIAQLEKLDRIIASRRKQAKVYGELIAGAGLDLGVPKEAEGSFHTYQSYVALLGKRHRGIRDKLIDSLKVRFGVETQVGTYSLHLQPSFAQFRGRSLLGGSELYRRTLALPTYVGLSEEDQEYVVSSIRSSLLS